MDQLRPKDRRKFVFSLFRANPGKSLPELVELISSLGVPRATIYRLYRKFSDGCDENASRQKFPVKLCVWIAVSAKGPSEPYFVPAKTALDSDLYIKECLLKRLSPYISEKFDNKRYIFWPDGASAHYAQKTIQAYSDLSINYVRKADNPPNIPHLRVIEKFWAHLKHKVYENNWSTTTILALKRRIKVKIAEFDSAYWRRLFASTRSDIADADEHGVLYKFSRI